MSLFDKFKKKEEKPAKKEEPKQDSKLKAKEKDDAAWAASKEKPVEKTTEKSKMAEDKKKADGKVWHITKRTDDGMWQVKAEGASKATKLFKTKAEAEEYVKTLVSNNEGSRVVKHKKTGEFQNKR